MVLRKPGYKLGMHGKNALPTTLGGLDTYVNGGGTLCGSAKLRTGCSGRLTAVVTLLENMLRLHYEVPRGASTALRGHRACADFLREGGVLASLAKFLPTRAEELELQMKHRQQSPMTDQAAQAAQAATLLIAPHELPYGMGCVFVACRRLCTA
jgi:hypothetical protein